MKHFWLGLGLLLALLGVSVWGWYAVKQVHEPLGEAADQAAEAALREDWEGAAAQTSRAQELWDRHRETVAALTGHQAVEKTDGLLKQLDLYLALRDRIRFAAACRDLSDLTEAEREAQSLTWWNLF